MMKERGETYTYSKLRDGQKREFGANNDKKPGGKMLFPINYT